MEIQTLSTLGLLPFTAACAVFAYLLFDNCRLRKLKLDLERRYADFKRLEAAKLKMMVKEKDEAMSALKAELSRLKYPDEIDSHLPILELAADLVYDADRQEYQRQNPRVSAISSKGKQFFGYRHASDLKHMPLEKLKSNLANYIAPPPSYLKDLDKDQFRVMKHFYGNQTPIARYPITFNWQHNDPEFQNKCFVPLIVESRKTDDGNGHKQEFMKVLYLDTETLPQYVLRRELWEKFIREKKIDFSLLAEELRKLQPKQVNERRAIEEALADLERGGSFQFIECCAKFGFFSLLEQARNLDLDQLRCLVEVIVGSEADVQSKSQTAAEEQPTSQNTLGQQARW